MRTLTVGLGVLVLSTAPLSAQSVFNATGMGLPTEALDARSRALGSLGIGLHDGSVLPTDPAAIGRLRLATGVMVAAPSWSDYTDTSGGSGTFQGSRFPLLGIAYPVFSGMMSLQVGSFLDQHFNGETTGSVILQGNTIDTSDRFQQDGAVANLNVGFARMIGPRTSVGLTLGRYAGSITRTLTRTYDSPNLPIQDYVEHGKWGYAGLSLTGGVSMDVTDVVRVAASVRTPSTLDATASSETGGADRSFSVPTQLRIGSSARLSPALLVTASAAFADWSGTAADLVETTAVGSGSGFGVGLELSRARLLGKNAPLRFGYRRTGLPFAFDDASATESIWSTGLGLDLNRTDDVLFAGADFALERGTREGSGFTEKFWRLTLSMIVAGF